MPPSTCVRISRAGPRSTRATSTPARGGEEKPVDVAFVQLDQIARDEGLTSCAFIKLDIEHAEFPALRGGGQLLKDLRPVICFENTPRHAARLNGYTMAEFSGFFEDLDYDLYDIFLNKMTRRRLAYDKFLPSYYLACPAERGALSEAFIASAEAMAQAFMDTAEG
ncbi:FkbM family methyltransferase [Mameliella sp. CS4]|uniref:FkbM family methyltransferase n=1 Tax=Mameliella sp. CS4 TaxID=2862329 RepID=UPI0021080565|nr:FkbM family methyltransferase [Mameliella sp. CS4]